MRKLLLSIMAIAVVTSLMGASLADFSDIESSTDNYFSTGSMDLKVVGPTGYIYEDPDIPVIFEVNDTWPCTSHDRRLGVINEGQGDQFTPYVYLHLKNIVCENIIKVEPEIAAEQGIHPVGEDKDGNYIYAASDRFNPAGPGNLPALGEFGENCRLSEHVDIEIWVSHQSNPSDPIPGLVPQASWDWVDLSQYDTDNNGIIKVNEIFCKQIELGQVENADDPTTIGYYEDRLFIKVALHLQDVDEDELIMKGQLIDPGTGYGWFDDTNPHERKWDHWPTNGLMKDKMYFDLSLELLQFQPGNVP